MNLDYTVEPLTIVEEEVINQLPDGVLDKAFDRYRDTVKYHQQHSVSEENKQNATGHFEGVGNHIDKGRIFADIHQLLALGPNDEVPQDTQTLIKREFVRAAKESGIDFEKLSASEQQKPRKICFAGPYGSKNSAVMNEWLNGSGDLPLDPQLQARFDALRKESEGRLFENDINKIRENHPVFKQLGDQNEELARIIVRQHHGSIYHAVNTAAKEMGCHIAVNESLANEFAAKDPEFKNISENGTYDVHVVNCICPLERCKERVGKSKPEAQVEASHGYFSQALKNIQRHAQNSITVSTANDKNISLIIEHQKGKTVESSIGEETKKKGKWQGKEGNRSNKGNTGGYDGVPG